MKRNEETRWWWWWESAKLLRLMCIIEENFKRAYCLQHFAQNVYASVMHTMPSHCKSHCNVIRILKWSKMQTGPQHKLNGEFYKSETLIRACLIFVMYTCKNGLRWAEFVVLWHVGIKIGCNLCMCVCVRLFALMCRLYSKSLCLICKTELVARIYFTLLHRAWPFAHNNKIDRHRIHGRILKWSP